MFVLYCSEAGNGIGSIYEYFHFSYCLLHNCHNGQIFVEQARNTRIPFYTLTMVSVCVNMLGVYACDCLLSLPSSVSYLAYKIFAMALHSLSWLQCNFCFRTFWQKINFYLVYVRVSLCFFDVYFMIFPKKRTKYS